jgi:RIO-like serine/threonine protein kinase
MRGKIGLFRLKSIAELMKVHGDLEGYNILSEKIKEMEKG